jgi:lipoprotein-anchoring transpeptidase ErfK/SrfK
MPRKPAVLSAAVAAGALSAASARAVDEPGPVVPLRSDAPPPAPARAPGAFTVERVRRGSRVALHARPGGPVIALAGARTQFGSPQTLAVARRIGHWLGVINEDVANGTIAWVKAGTRALRTARTRTVIRVSLARRRLELVDGRQVERRMTVGVGRPGSPTPKGRFSVTDKLPGTGYGAAYGCCILALSGRQSHVPASWHGGNRLAIHGTNAPATIGRRASLGCLHARTHDLKLLMRRVPLGTPVFIGR